MLLRLAVGGATAPGAVPAGAAAVRDPFAGLVFAAVLGSLVALVRPRPRAVVAPRALAWGVVGAVILCAVPLVAHLRHPGGALDPAALPVWALVVTAVAVAEEAFLRGALWDGVQRASGERVALVVSTVAFGLLHVPFYGVAALPLDLAVGLLLGALRLLTGGWAAPAVAHTLADLAGWWLR